MRIRNTRLPPDGKKVANSDDSPRNWTIVFLSVLEGYTIILLGAICQHHSEKDLVLVGDNNNYIMLLKKDEPKVQLSTQQLIRV